MNNTKFLRGMGVGMAVGAALSMAMHSKKKCGKSPVGKAMKAVSEAAENISEAMGM